MRIGELWLNKLGIPIPKPKEQVLTLIELLLHSVVTGKTVPELIALLDTELKVKDSITVQALETVGRNLELIKLSTSVTAASLYLKLLPELEIHRQDKMKVTCRIYTTQELGEALNIHSTIDNSFKSVLYKSIATINDTLEKDIIVIKRVLKEQKYKVLLISNLSGIDELRRTLIENGIQSLADMDKYEFLWRSKFE